MFNIGGLVQKILQTKKDLEGSDAAEGGKTMISKDPKAPGLKEIEALRSAIQLLCQNTNPLGKTVDYMQEDVDSMNKELSIWTREASKYKLILEEELRFAHENQKRTYSRSSFSLTPLFPPNRRLLF